MSFSSLHSPSSLLLSLLFYLFLPSGITPIKIIQHSISQTLNLRSNSSQGEAVLLDCEYSHDPGDGDAKLVVRWFYNDSPEPVYQWIPESDKRYVGELIRPHFDMNFRVSGDPFTRFRAIRLRPITPTGTLPLSLSGNYTCLISSILNQDSRQGHLTIFMPPSNFEFSLHVSPSSVSSNPSLRCLAEQVYPRPRLVFTSLSPPSTPTISPVVELEHNQTSQLYRTWMEVPLEVNNIQVGTIYECRLELDAANYVRRKRIKLIYPSIYSYVSNKKESNHGQTKMERTPASVENIQGVNWLQTTTKMLNDYQAQLHKTSSATRSHCTLVIICFLFLLVCCFG